MPVSPRSLCKALLDSHVDDARLLQEDPTVCRCSQPRCGMSLVSELSRCMRILYGRRASPSWSTGSCSTSVQSTPTTMTKCGTGRTCWQRCRRYQSTRTVGKQRLDRWDHMPASRKLRVYAPRLPLTCHPVVISPHSPTHLAIFTELFARPAFISALLHLLREPGVQVIVHPCQHHAVRSCH